MLRLIGAPLAGAAALLFCALALGLDPLVSAIVGALVWAGVQLLWDGEGAAGAVGDGAGIPTAEQARQLDAAADRVAALDALAAEIRAPGLAEALAGIARRAERMIGAAQADPGLSGLYRRPLGNYLAQALELGRRVLEAEGAGRLDDALAARLPATLARLDALFAAVEEKGAALDRLDLDARIAVLEAEIAADLGGTGGGRPSAR